MQSWYTDHKPCVTRDALYSVHVASSTSLVARHLERSGGADDGHCAPRPWPQSLRLVPLLIMAKAFSGGGVGQTQGTATGVLDPGRQHRRLG